jgi:hypothetical protein
MEPKNHQFARCIDSLAWPIFSPLTQQQQSAATAGRAII